MELHSKPIAQEMIEDGQYQEAIIHYSRLREEVSDNNPVYPLLLHDLARAHELNGNLENSVAQYTALKEIRGFTTIGFLGEARLYEQMGKNDQARDAYEKALAQQGLSPAMQEWLEYKLDNI